MIRVRLVNCEDWREEGNKGSGYAKRDIKITLTYSTTTQTTNRIKGY